MWSSMDRQGNPGATPIPPQNRIYVNRLCRNESPIDDFQACDQRRHVIGQRGLETHLPPVPRRAVSAPRCMQLLAGASARAHRVGAVDEDLLAEQHVPAEPRLRPDLVAPAGDERALEERPAAQRFDDSIPADRFFTPRIAGMRLLLNKRL